VETAASGLPGGGLRRRETAVARDPSAAAAGVTGPRAAGPSAKMVVPLSFRGQRLPTMVAPALRRGVTPAGAGSGLGRDEGEATIVFCGSSMAAAGWGGSDAIGLPGVSAASEPAPREIPVLQEHAPSRFPTECHPSCRFTSAGKWNAPPSLLKERGVVGEVYTIG
jgi:hypothetical protein